METTIEIIDLARRMVDIIADMKGEDIVLLDVHEQTVIADYFVICNGGSERQLKAIVEKVTMEIKKEFHVYPRRMDGDATSGWVLIDYGDIILHAFSPETRAYYRLEELWHESPVLLKMQ